MRICQQFSSSVSLSLYFMFARSVCWYLYTYVFGKKCYDITKCGFLSDGWKYHYLLYIGNIFGISYYKINNIPRHVNILILSLCFNMLTEINILISLVGVLLKNITLLNLCFTISRILAQNLRRKRRVKTRLRIVRVTHQTKVTTRIH